MITLCLTFDDGLKDHHDIVAPMLEKYGWRGAFNVPTTLMDKAQRNCDLGWVRDICLDGHEDNLMSWEDVRDLISRGHEVYPHTCDHINLLELEKQGRVDEVVRQIEMSTKQFVMNTGQNPAFFCSPHNKKSDLIERIVRRNGMELFECWRENFGKKIPYVFQGTITEFVKNRFSAGWRHLDVMIHGIESAHGGWAPFKDRDEFMAFLDEIRDMETKGMVRVVPYSTCHRRHSAISPFLNLVDRAVGKARRCIYKWLRYR